MIPYADFTYFVLLLYMAVPTVILGLFGRARWRWALLVTTVMLVVQYHDALHLRKHFLVSEIWLVLAFAVWQWLIVRGFAGAGARAGWLFYTAIGLSVLPLALAKGFRSSRQKPSSDFLVFLTSHFARSISCFACAMALSRGLAESIYSCFCFFSPRFPPARSIVIADSLPTGEKHEAALNSWLISTVPCSISFADYSTSSSSRH